MQLGVFRFVDDTHASAAKFFEHVEMRNIPAGKRLFSGHVRAILERAPYPSQLSAVTLMCGGRRNGGRAPGANRAPVGSAEGDIEIRR